MVSVLKIKLNDTAMINFKQSQQVLELQYLPKQYWTGIFLKIPE